MKVPDQTADTEPMSKGLPVPLAPIRPGPRALVAVLTLVLLAACGAPARVPAPGGVAPSSGADAPAQQVGFEQLERQFGARLGVYAVDTATGREVAYRADERFAYASTHKVFSAGEVLRRTPLRELGRTLTFRRSDLVAGSPISEQHVDTGMTLRAVLDAALRYSDNTAADLLFTQLGGPAGLASALRAIGDSTTHVDRIEPELNLTDPGDIRDTSTPRAMAATLRAFTLGPVLPQDKRTLLVDFMRANTTGNSLIRAGAPAGWPVADKSGTADHGIRNDIGLVWPPNRAPIVLVVLSARPAKDAPHDDALIARATTVALTAFR
jgi:beta-lactamase class A